MGISTLVRYIEPSLEDTGSRNIPMRVTGKTAPTYLEGTLDRYLLVHDLLDHVSSMANKHLSPFTSELVASMINFHGWSERNRPSPLGVDLAFMVDTYWENYFGSEDYVSDLKWLQKRERYFPPSTKEIVESALTGVQWVNVEPEIYSTDTYFVAAQEGLEELKKLVYLAAGFGAVEARKYYPEPFVYQDFRESLLIFLNDKRYLLIDGLHKLKVYIYFQDRSIKAGYKYVFGHKYEWEWVM